MRKHSPVFPKLLWGGYIPCRRVEYRGEWWYQSLREVAKHLESGRYEDMAELAEMALPRPDRKSPLSVPKGCD